MFLTYEKKVISDQIFENLIYDSILQKDGYYETSNGRIIWTNQEMYKKFNSSLVARFISKPKSKIKTTKSKKKK